ncbi:hypothetical protein JCM10213_008503 [Rhodosporidiobolus nylandii]
MPKARHAQMFSIGGVIGTGLFLGVANALRNGGPLGLLLGYAAVGTICYSVMICLGELVAHLPVPGGHITLSRRFVSPAFSFAMGWNSAPFSRRQLLDTLSIDYGSPGPVYYSNSKYECPLQYINISGQHPPFQLDYLFTPFNAADLASQNATLIGTFKETGSVSWNPTVLKGKHFALRLTDAEGNVRYSAEKWLKSGGKHSCENINPNFWEKADPFDRFWLVVGVILAGGAGVIILLFLVAFIYEGVRGLYRWLKAAWTRRAERKAAIGRERDLEMAGRAEPQPAVVVQPAAPAGAEARAAEEEEAPPAYR